MSVPGAGDDEAGLGSLAVSADSEAGALLLALLASLIRYRAPWARTTV
ncbi:hypothetical protein ACGFJC_05620 [Nonomuraea fuscirosea]